MNVPLSSPDIGKRETEMILKVLNGNILSMGPMLQRFEQLMAAFLGVRYTVAVNSGTSGLHLAVRALGIGKGDEVITTPFSFIASCNCLLYEQAIPKFVDIEPLTLNLDPERIEGKITPRTKAILPVHIFGHPADMKRILEIARKYNLAVIEDACEALGASYQRIKAGSEGDVSVFAFYPNKQITTGEGGMIATNNREIAELCRSMRNQGRDRNSKWLEHIRLGYNYRMDEFSAAVGVAQIERIEEILEKRHRAASEYTARLEGYSWVRTPYIAPGIEMSWFVYVIRLSPEINRETVMDYMEKEGIDCRPYFTPIHLQPFYRKRFGFCEGEFPIAEREAASTLALPFFSNLSIEQIDYVVDKLIKAIKMD